MTFCPSLKRNSAPSMLGRLVRFGRPYFFTFASVISEYNFAFVRIFFKDFGCLLLLTIRCVYKISFNISFLCSISRLWVLIVNVSLLLMLHVDMQGSIFGWGVLMCWTILEVFYADLCCSLILFSMRWTVSCLSVMFSEFLQSKVSVIFLWHYCA